MKSKHEIFLHNLSFLEFFVVDFSLGVTPGCSQVLLLLCTQDYFVRISWESYVEQEIEPGKLYARNFSYLCTVTGGLLEFLLQNK